MLSVIQGKKVKATKGLGQDNSLDIYKDVYAYRKKGSSAYRKTGA